MKEFNMPKLPAILIMLIAFIGFNINAKAQTYTVESFEGVPTKLKLCDTLQHSRLLAISHLKDTVEIEGWRGINKVSVIGKRFLMIDCGVRGGSGLTLNNTTILCVVKNKIKVCLSMCSYAHNVELPEKDYTLIFNLKDDNTGNYQLIAKFQNNGDFKKRSALKHNLLSYAKLSFDSELHVFFSEKRKINRYFTLEDGRYAKSKKRLVSGVFPALSGDQTYYFIKGQWYSEGYDDTLYKMTF